MRENCAACHGATGDANAPMARGMDPPPIAFTDRARARERSLFALYQVIDQGLEGTAMASFAHLPRGGPLGARLPRRPLRLSRGAGRAGPAASGRAIRRCARGCPISRPGRDHPGGAGPRDRRRTRRAAVTAYLARQSRRACAAGAGGSQSLAVARELLRQSLAAYRGGDRARASELALSAYLDGFEPVEAVLAARDGGLIAEVERAMGELRAAIGARRTAADVARADRAARRPVRRAERALAPEAGERRFDLPRRLRHPASRGARGAADRHRDDRLPAQGGAAANAALRP